MHPTVRTSALGSTPTGSHVGLNNDLEMTSAESSDHQANATQN